MTSDIVTIKTNIATDIHINNYDELHKRLQSDSSTKKKNHMNIQKGATKYFYYD